MRRVLPRRLAVLTFVSLTSVAGVCDLLEPSDPYEGVEGTWTLTRIAGAPVPAAGYALTIPTPLGTVDTGYKLHGGSLQFSQPSSGSVVAEYRISKDGFIEPEAFYTGSFVYDGQKPGKVTLSTLKKESVEGNVDFEAKVGNVFQPEGTLVIDQLVWVKEPGTGVKVPVPVKVTLVRARLDLD
jgi:hypothetical protein